MLRIKNVKNELNGMMNTTLNLFYARLFFGEIENMFFYLDQSEYTSYQNVVALRYLWMPPVYDCIFSRSALFQKCTKDNGP